VLAASFVTADVVPASSAPDSYLHEAEEGVGTIERCRVAMDTAVSLHFLCRQKASSTLATTAPFDPLARLALFSKLTTLALLSLSSRSSMLAIALVKKQGYDCILALIDNGAHRSSSRSKRACSAVLR
jgi:hypothetical protein